MRILIADDEAFVVEGLTLLLHQNLPQVEIMTADNGRSALAVLRERGAEPDLLITDLNMPLMDGIELSQQIRRRYPRCRIMISAVTRTSRPRAPPLSWARFAICLSPSTTPRWWPM